MSGWYRQMRDVHALLTGPAASVRLVLTPERVVLAEARRTWTSLGLYGFAVDGVVVNRVIPAAAARGDAWRRSWNEAQRAGLVEVAESFAGLPILRVPYLAGEPIGTDALDALAGLIEGDVTTTDDPLGVLGPVRHDGMRVRRVRFRLRAEPAAAARPRARGRPQAARRRAARVGGRPPPSAQPAGRACSGVSSAAPASGRGRCG